MLPVGGASIARHQLALALALGCRKIVALARNLSPGMLALQHEAERAGARFHAISAVRQFAGLVTADDDLVVLADGLLADDAVATMLLNDKPAVLVQPVEAGLAAGFERIDLNHATAGAMRIPGHVVDRLNELPADCDVVSALTRIALQSGVPQQAIPDSALSRGVWQLVRTDEDAQRVENDWIAARLRPASSTAPTSVLSRPLARRFGPALLHAANGMLSLHVAAILCLLLALVAGWFAATWLGLLLVGLGVLLRHTAALLGRLGLAPTAREVQARREEVFGWLADVAIVAIVAWNLPHDDWHSGSASAFAPMMLILTLRLVATRAEAPVAAWLADRLALTVVVTAFALAGWLLPGVMALTIVVAITGLVGFGTVNRLG